MNKIISTKDLTLSNLPRKNANWDRISSFALTWDPKIELMDKQYHFSLNHLPNEDSSIIEIRAYIYQQQRSWNHQSREPDSKSLQKIHQTIELLRNKYRKNENPLHHLFLQSQISIR